MQAEAFLTVASREKSHLPSLALKGSLTTLRQLKKYPKIPVFTREGRRGSPHYSRRALGFPPHLERRVNFPALLGKESRCSRRTSRERGLNLTLEKNSRCLATISKVADVPMHSRYT